MSWTDYARLIDSGEDKAAEWVSAAKSNPGDAATALKVAVLNRIIDCNSMEDLEVFCLIITSLAYQADGFRQENIALRAQLEAARAVIRPFGRVIFGSSYSDDELSQFSGNTVGDYRKAAAWLAGKEEK